MLYSKAIPILLALVMLPGVVAAEDVTPPVNPDERQTLPGMPAYYEPHKIERIGDMLVFKLYRYGKPGVADEVGQYMLECATRMASTIKNGQAGASGKVLPGEDLYVVGKKLCDWDKPGLLDKLLDQR